jgi:hypothetical protein
VRSRWAAVFLGVRWIGGVAVEWLECGLQPAYSVAWQLVVGEL